MIDKFLEDQRGYITLVALMLIPVFLLLTALVIDTGYLLAQKAEIQGIADALALASSSGVYRKIIEVKITGPNEQELIWDWFISPKLAQQEGYRYMDHISSNIDKTAPGHQKKVVIVEEITVEPTEKQVKVKVKTQVRPGLLQWGGNKYLHATGSAGLNTGGGKNPVPRVDGLP